MSDKLTLQEQAAKYQAMVAKRTEAQRKRRAKKRADGMREVTAWVREMPEGLRESFTPVLVWVAADKVADYQARHRQHIPCLRQSGGAQVLAWIDPAKGSNA